MIFVKPKLIDMDNRELKLGQWLSVLEMERARIFKDQDIP
ncbi:hypothetical protein SAMN05660653_02687 [Desulfonatronum thiosulfatophilum]|uniref:Uncharacterized protein n=1 Tax=Desulfonatronum thiosulfatophilum TaxID=617002 RepID=A0A1G6E8X4_9BACT|nr:hypothetical protein SAMN05660653_02687 [Desulfonatronum thiosulfatophilum]